jgi:hypothetical protein
MFGAPRRPWGYSLRYRPEAQNNRQRPTPLLWYLHQPRHTKITNRTKLLALLTLILLLAAGTIAHRRLTLCKMQIHPGSHRAPIPGSSGDPANFGCKLLDPATLTEKIIDLACFLTTLAFFRSLWMDIHLWKSKFPPSTKPKRQFGREVPPLAPRE